jgi:hypothetical protein
MGIAISRTVNKPPNTPGTKEDGWVSLTSVVINSHTGFERRKMFS